MTMWKASVVSVVLFALLASGSLVKAARGQEPGLGRDASMKVASAIDRVSNLLSLNRPLDAANEALHREDIEPDIKFPPVTVPADGVTKPTLPPRTITSGAPLVVRVFGDSQSRDLAVSMQNAAAGDARITIDDRGKVSTGLARPDYYNWPARLQEQLSQADADVVVFMAGDNDDQSLQDREGHLVATIGTPEWAEEYRRRVAGIMDLVDNHRRKLVWVGDPAVGVDSLNRTIAVINPIVADEAARRPGWVTYVAPSKVLEGPNGESQDYVTLPGGTAPVKCRRGDGVHLTVDCIRVLADQALAAIRPMFSLDVATTTTAPAVTSTTVAPVAPTTTTTK